MTRIERGKIMGRIARWRVVRMLSEHPLLPTHESEEADAWKAELAAHVRSVVTTPRIEMRKLHARLLIQVQRDRLISAAAKTRTERMYGYLKLGLRCFR